MTIYEVVNPCVGDPYQLQYQSYSGGYRDMRILQNKDGTQLPDAENVGVQDFIGQRLGALLQNSNHPVVFMDVGGAAGLSAMRLAKQYETEVRDSKLAVVVTSANLPIDEYIKGLRGSWADEAAALNQEGLVHQKHTDFTSIPDTSISLPDGTTYDLREGVDVVHERLSLTAWAPNFAPALLTLGELLSSNSLYMVRRKDMTEGHNLDGQFRMRPVWAVGTTQAVVADSRGLEIIDHCEEGPYSGYGLTYRMLRGLDTAPVHIEPVPGGTPWKP